MELIPAVSYDALELLPGQETFVATPEAIRKALTREDTFGFDAVENGVRFGFAMVRQFGPEEYFLWEYILDARHQGQGKGYACLSALIALLRREYGLKTLWTTYIWGNDAARRLYERVGFTQTDVVDEDGIHEVNMVLHFT